MTHVRSRVRSAFKATLGDVGVNRRRPWPKGVARALGVRTPREVARDLDMDGGQDRTITVMVDITGAAGSTEALSDAFDEAAAEVERAVFAAGDLGGIAQAVGYRGAQLAVDEGAHKAAGTLSLAFEVAVYTVETDPETAL